MSLLWPYGRMAQLAGMSSEAFCDYYFSVCNFDYGAMKRGATALHRALLNTDWIHVIGPGATDLRFSIKGIGAKACMGEINLPDGEVFTAPRKKSVNGVIQFNTPSVYQGNFFSDIRLTIEQGKIVDASCGVGNTRKLQAILSSDDGACYIGEFALAFHPLMDRPICDILFDEKIAGSIHLTPGQCYRAAYNGNSSSIHWDMVLLQRPEFGGGEVWFDNKLIRKDGMFVMPSLESLNPENLIKRTRAGSRVGRREG